MSIVKTTVAVAIVLAWVAMIAFGIVRGNFDGIPLVEVTPVVMLGAGFLLGSEIRHGLASNQGGEPDEPGA